MKVSVIGSGNVGATAAFLIAQRDLADVVLVDVVEGMPQGKSLDMNQASSLLEFNKEISGNSDFKAISDSEIVVVTAGLSRQPGMSRADLLTQNSQIISDVAEKIAKHAPASKIVMVTNPLDVMTQIAFIKSGFERERILGMGGLLDTARFKFFISQELDVSIEKIEAMVIGSHNNVMLPLLHSAKSSQELIGSFLTSERMEKIADKTKNGGAEIVSYLKTGSAFYAPAAGVLRIVEAIINGTDEELLVCTYLKGEYGLNDVCLSVPVKVGDGGIEEIIEIDLGSDEKEALQKCADSVKESLKVVES